MPDDAARASAGNTGAKFCNCGPRECFHPSNLINGYVCRVQAAEHAALQATITRLQEELHMGHVRLNECVGWEATKDLSLYARISKKIEELVYAKSEVEHMLAATGHEKDELRAKAGAAEHRRIAAEYRATRIELDKELQAKLKATEADLTAARAALGRLRDQLEAEIETSLRAVDRESFMVDYGVIGRGSGGLASVIERSTAMHLLLFVRGILRDAKAPGADPAPASPPEGGKGTR
jgi:hypothetical protein